MSVTRDEWDEQCSRWRWPEGENCVVYPLGEGRVRVLDESTGVTWQVLKEEVNIDGGVPPLYRSAARDYFKAQEPNPWAEAKPGEVWVLSYLNLAGERLTKPAIRKVENKWQFDIMTVHVSDSALINARRIWPEVD